MDLVDKITSALMTRLDAEYVRLDNEDGISGFVVTRQFEAMSTLDRQGLIEEALRAAELSPHEYRSVLMIAGLTPEEYESVGSSIRVHDVSEHEDGRLDVQVLGGYSDALYVRGSFAGEKGVETTEPETKSVLGGTVMSFQAFSTDDANPLTRDKALRLLSQHPYVSVPQLS